MTSEEETQTFQTDDVHYPELGRAPDWSCRVGNLLQPIRSTTQISVVKRHQYGLFALVSQYVISRRKQFSQASTMTKGNFQSVEDWRD